MPPSEPPLTLEQLGVLLDDLPEGIVVYRLEDPEDHRSLRLVYANRAAELQSGVPMRGLVGGLIEECFPKLRELSYPARFARVARTGVPDHNESLHYDDAQVLAVAFEVHAIQLSQGVVAVRYENVTLRKQIEIEATRTEVLQQEAVRRSALVAELEAANEAARGALESYEMIADAAEEALWELLQLEPGAAITSETPCRFSPRFTDLLGCEPAEIPPVLGAFQRFIHPDDMPRLGEAYEVMFTQPGTRLKVQHRVITKSGELRWWQASACAVFGADGRLRKAAGAVRDITEERRAQAALEERIALIERQRSLIEQLSTPILQVWDGVIALPIIGAIDAARGAALMEQLLSEIAARGVRAALVDLTGVEEIDPATADHLVRIAAAVRLLGARAIITGIRPAVAQAMCAIGIDLSALETRRSLEEGLRGCVGPRADPARRA